MAQWQCRRPYSIQSQEEAIAKLPGINPSALSITTATILKELVSPEELVFGRTFTGKLPSSLNNLGKKLRREKVQTTCFPSNGPLPKAGSPHE